MGYDTHREHDASERGESPLKGKYREYLVDGSRMMGVGLSTSGMTLGALVEPIEPVRLSRDEWETILLMIREANAVLDILDGQKLERSLLTGESLRDLLEAGRDMRHLIEKR